MKKIILELKPFCLIFFIITGIFYITYLLSSLIFVVQGINEWNNFVKVNLLFLFSLIIVTVIGYSKINNKLKIIIQNFDKKTQIIISLLLIYFFFVGLGIDVYYSFNKSWNSADVINLFILGTYIVAPLAVIWAYIDWKSPKQYEIEKEYAEKILNTISQPYYFLYERANQLKDLKDLKDNLVVLNSLYKKKDIHLETYFYEAHNLLVTFNDVSKEIINNEQLIALEKFAHILDSYCRYIIEEYDKIYKILPVYVKSSPISHYQSYDGVTLNKEEMRAKFNINRYLNEKLEIMEENDGSNKIVKQLTFIEIINEFKENYENLRGSLTKFIKIKK